MMKRAFASVLASAMMLFALAGCSGGGNETAQSETQDPAPEESSQTAEPVTISVGVPTAPPALPDDYLELQPELPRWRALLEL